MIDQHVHCFRPHASAPIVPPHLEQQFSELNAVEHPAWLGKVRAWIGQMEFQFLHRFHWETHFSVEYLGTGVGAANYFQDALLAILNLLSEMSDDQSKHLLDALQYALQIEQENCSILADLRGFTEHHLAQTIQRNVSALSVGQYVAIPCTFGNHATLMAITCTHHDDGGKKTYQVTIHNTGEGFEQYHYCKRCSDGKIRFQTALEIGHISEDTLCSGPFFEKILRLGRTASLYGLRELYEEILPLLKGTVLPPSKNYQLWSHGQLGGTCTMLCLLSFVRSQSSNTWFKKFRDLGRVHALVHGYRDIKSGVGNFSAQKLITLEMVRSLQRSFWKRGAELPAPLLETKRQLVELASTSCLHSSEHHKELVNTTKTRIARLLSACVSCVQSECWDLLPEILERTATRAIAMSKKSARISEKDMELFHTALQELQAFSNERILPAQQIYLIAAIAAIFLKFGVALTDTETNFCEHWVYKSMFLRTKVDKAIGNSAQHLLTSSYAPWEREVNDIHIPEGLISMQHRMS